MNKKIDFIDINKLQLMPENKRRGIDNKQVEKIKDNIQNSGYKDGFSLTVTPKGNKYTVIDGNHRLIVLRELKYSKKVPCVILENVEDKSALTLVINTANENGKKNTLFDYLDYIARKKEKLKAWNSQESIADILGVSKKTISNVINSCKKAQMDDFTQNFEPYLYNIWKQKNQDNNNEDHFGSFPLTYMKNLLYYHTEPLDIIFDPFAGGGTTVDTCKEMFRRYYCTDRKVRAGREKEIKKHDIKEGLPDNLPKPDLTFLDPPYWKQAEGKYSNSEDDLGNMKLNEFYESIQKLFNQLVDRGSKKIALVIQPTQYANDFNFEDHVMKFNQMLSNKYEIEMRYILPYSTQQYNAQMVEKAKEKKECLALHRDLIIWSRDIDD